MIHLIDLLNSIVQYIKSNRSPDLVFSSLSSSPPSLFPSLLRFFLLSSALLGFPSSLVLSLILTSFSSLPFWLTLLFASFYPCFYLCLPNSLPPLVPSFTPPSFPPSLLLSLPLSLSPRSAPGPASQIQALENTLKFLQLQELGKLYSLRARPRWVTGHSSLYFYCLPFRFCHCIVFFVRSWFPVFFVSVFIIGKCLLIDFFFSWWNGNEVSAKRCLVDFLVENMRNIRRAEFYEELFCCMHSCNMASAYALLSHVDRWIAMHEESNSFSYIYKQMTCIIKTPFTTVLVSQFALILIHARSSMDKHKTLTHA